MMSSFNNTIVNKAKEFSSTVGFLFTPQIGVRKGSAVDFGGADLYEWSRIKSHYCRIVATPLRHKCETLGDGLLADNGLGPPP